MINLPATSEITMSSLDFLNGFINPAREAAGEKEVRNNDFIKRIEDECDDLGAYESFVSFGKQSKLYQLTYDQMMLVGMRESKHVRKAVLVKLKELASGKAAIAKPTPAEEKADVLIAIANRGHNELAVRLFTASQSTNEPPPAHQEKYNINEIARQYVEVIMPRHPNANRTALIEGFRHELTCKFSRDSVRKAFNEHPRLVNYRKGNK